MSCCIIFTHVNVKFYRIFLQEIDIKFIDFVDKRELGLIICANTLAHLSRFRTMIVKVDCDNSDELLFNFVFRHVNA